MTRFQLGMKGLHVVGEEDLVAAHNNGRSAAVLATFSLSSNANLTVRGKSVLRNGGNKVERYPRPATQWSQSMKREALNMWKKGLAVLCLAVVGVALAAGSGLAEQIKIDPKLSDYVKVQGVSGNLNSVGSDTLNNLMILWAEGFRKKYPNVNIQIEGKGSSTAPPATWSGSRTWRPTSPRTSTT